MRPISLIPLALVSTVAAAQSPVGHQFQVNTYNTGLQERPAIGSVGAGGFVVAWRSTGSYGDDNDNWSVQAQRYAADGSPQGDQFQVNTYSTSLQLFPAVAPQGDGGFVVAWTSDGSSGTDADQTSIQAQRFSADGSPLGAEFQVNTYTTSYQHFPVVSPNGDDGFVVVWDSSGSSGTDQDAHSIHAQRYAADGSPLGDELQVNTFTPNPQIDPAVSPDGKGGFVVVWNSLGSNGTDNHHWSVQAQRYAADGSPLGIEFQVNTYTTDNQLYPSVGPCCGGGFVVTWTSDAASGSDTDSWSVQAQRYAADGSLLGGEFQVNTYTTSYQYFPAVSPIGTGGFVVTWTSGGSSGTDTSVRSIQAQQFAADGSPIGLEFQINTNTIGYQQGSAAAPDGAGGFVVAWEDSFASDSIQAKRGPYIFVDGFESGDTSAWSNVVP